MLERPNALVWDGTPGHYEVHYLTLTDPGTGIGVWIRLTMVAPVRAGEPPTAALWFLAMDPRPGWTPLIGHKQTLGIDQLQATAEPFELRIGDAVLTDGGTSGRIDDVSWDLRWVPARTEYEHVHPLLRRAGVARTVLVLPHADLAIDGTIELPGETLALSGARGGQAHLWGSKHANRWAWVHCNDFTSADGQPVTGAFVDGVSVFVPRLGRETGPNTPVVGRVGDEDFLSTSPLRVLRNTSEFGLTHWRFEATAGNRRLVGEVQADAGQLAGVTYHDPDGDLAYCYNGETASMQLTVHHRSRPFGRWSERETLLAPGRAHFEYAQREPVPGLGLLTN